MVAVSDSFNIKLYNISIHPESVKQANEEVLLELPGALHLRFAPCGKILVFAGTDSKIYVLDLKTFKVIGVHNFHGIDRKSGEENPRFITSLCISPCGKWVVSGDSGRKMVSYSLTNLKVTHI
jgi:WD40 repeat protein